MSYCKPFRRGVSWRSQNFGANATIYGPHSGNDDAANIGTPVHAAGDGVVDWAGEFDDTYLDNLLWLLRMGGNILVLNCGANEPSFVYGHLHSFTVKRGDRVRKGQVIAYSGNTGTATTGAHLHTEAIPPGFSLNSPMLGRVNPDIYLTEWPEDIAVGSLTPAGETITPLEDTLSAAEVKQITDAIAEVKTIAANTHAGVWNGGTNKGKKFNYGILPIVAESQRRQSADAAQIKALVGALAAVAKGESFDEAKLLAGVQAAAEAGVKAGLEDGTVTVDVNVNGGAK